jgi:2Fe-2S ferredoxin
MRIVFKLPDQSQVDVDASEGQSLMRAAVDNGIPGILGDCGGQCACATCHIYIDQDWIGKIGPANLDSTENMMLEGAPVDIRSNSRLGCQIILNADCDGLIVQVPEGQ